MPIAHHQANREQFHEPPPFNWRPAAPASPGASLAALRLARRFCMSPALARTVALLIGLGPREQG